MTRQIDLINISETITSFEGVTNADMLPLGRRSEVLSVLSKNCPDWKFPVHPTHPDRGGVVSEQCHLEFYIPDDEPILMLGLDVYTGDDAVVMGVIRSICQATGWRAFDPAEEELIDFAN
ncbi:MAG: hypothetical protein LH647_18070 [Leptolyngbyaceae cyanobacterium CAN_BIN12]|nr:hypothetical protein [Leptolyngbyaceae cyanobacterium CAN_BIN12]